MKPIALVTTVPSDSHHWNLIFMELLIKEHGYDVVNLGPCVPYPESVNYYKSYRPDIMVVSTINGHGYIEGLSLINQLKKEVPETKNIFIGGNLGIDQKSVFDQILELENNGFTKAYNANKDLEDFKSRIKKIFEINNEWFKNDRIRRKKILKQEF